MSTIECLTNIKLKNIINPLILLFGKFVIASIQSILHRLEHYTKWLTIALLALIVPLVSADDLPLPVQIDIQTKIIHNLVKNQECGLAIEHIKQLQQLTPKLDLPILYYQGDCYFKLRDLDNALQSLKTYLAYGKNADSNYQQALKTYILIEQNLHQQKKIAEQKKLLLQSQQKQEQQKRQHAKEIQRQQQDLIAKLQWPMIKIEPGCFYMGSLENIEEQPMHRVCLDSTYAIGQYEVTQQQWQAVMQNKLTGFNPNQTNSCTKKNCAVTSVSWPAIQIFIRKLNQLSQKHYRLPTEAEWEYACRNLGKNQRSCNESSLDAIFRSYNNNLRILKPVNQTFPNLIDIYGMNGNVTEWVQDYFSDSYYANSPLNNPQGPNRGTTRVIRSGCCYTYDNRTNINRFGQKPIYFDDSLGFRLVQDL